MNADDDEQRKPNAGFRLRLFKPPRGAMAQTCQLVGPSKGRLNTKKKSRGAGGA